MRVCLAAVLAVVLSLPARAVEIQEVTSPGGITAWLVEEHSIPFAAIELRFRGGASLDTPGKRGAVNLMMGLLEEGAADMDAQEFLVAREELAADYGFDASNDTVSVSARFLTENRAASVDLLRKALTEPRFDPTALERVRGQVQSIIADNAKDPRHIANATFDRMAFGDHPYGSSLNGTAASVAALDRDDIMAAHKAALARDRVYVGVVGDITAEELGPLLDRLLGGLPAEGAPMPKEAPWMLEGGETVVPFATPQSVAVFGHRGMREDDPDFFAAYILNHILGGGGFGSRLMAEVREKRGLTYGVYSYLAPMDHAELIMGQVASANATVGEAVEVIRAEWRKLARDGITAAELDEAKTYLTGAFPLRFDGNSTIARILAGMQITGRPIDYIDTRNDRIEAVTLDEINRVAGELLDPEALHFVIVGEPEGMGAGN
ncbi:peptidase M16 [Maritimibacter sp. 55A14]|uniref:M16 family metallopeptidase n=1 Tax=Maritimibacter sp. 55A14 TaxID=2174844 RepID=UPI000D61452C|nr:pitrilysin family protein [Maritimibacter sp. 55A14]PWE29418.1 peptidase M16 [Maritimibacter sp. 55A14]